MADMHSLKEFRKTPLHNRGTSSRYIDMIYAHKLLYTKDKELKIDGMTIPLIRTKASIAEARGIAEKKPEPGVKSGGTIKKNYANGGRVAKSSMEKS